ncbi:hypothetical protein D3C71_1889010 [compost metagenome]
MGAKNRGSAQGEQQDATDRQLIRPRKPQALARPSKQTTCSEHCTDQREMIAVLVCQLQRYDVAGDEMRGKEKQYSQGEQRLPRTDAPRSTSQGKQKQDSGQRCPRE